MHTYTRGKILLHNCDQRGKPSKSLKTEVFREPQWTCPLCSNNRKFAESINYLFIPREHGVVKNAQNGGNYE